MIFFLLCSSSLFHLFLPVSTPRSCFCQCPSPHNESHPSPPSTGDLLIPAGKSGPVFYEVIAFTSGSWCTPYPVCSLQEWNSCGETPLAFRAIFSRGSSSHCQNPQAGEPDMGFITSTAVEEPLWCNPFLVCGLPTSNVGSLGGSVVKKKKKSTCSAGDLGLIPRS